MSTKTTFKRVALVAVAALGLGVLSSVAPATAGTTKTAMNVTDISWTTDKTPVAGANGTSSVHSIRFTTDSSTATVVNAGVILVSAPALSAMAQEAEDGSLSAAGKWQMASTAAAADHNPVAKTITSSTAFDTQTADITAATGTNAAGNYYHDFYMHAWYDVAGTYVWSVRDESTASSTSVGGIDYSETFTVVVSGSATATSAVGTLTAFNSTSVIESTNGGSIVKVGLKDAAGNAVSPDTSSGVTVTLSGSAKVYKVNGATAGSVGTYSLGAGDFDSSGIAYLNIINGTAETVTVSVSNNGFSSFTAPSSISLTFKDATPLATNAATAIPVAVGASNLKSTNATTYGYSSSAGSKTVSFLLDTVAAASTDYDYATVTDTSGYITGRAGLVYAVAIARSSSTVAGVLSVTTTDTASNFTFSVNTTGGATITASATTRAIGSVTVSSADSFKAITGATNSWIVRVKDNFGNGYGVQTVSAAIAGRNSAVAVASASTDADGYATLSYKDASTSTTSLTDTVTFTAGTLTDTASVSYVTSLGVSTVLLVTPNTDAYGVTQTIATATDIEAGDGAETATGATVTATVKDAAGVALSGVAVVFTVSGTGAAVPSTQVTGYTSVLGKASATLYGWISGTYTVTATAGGVSDTAPVNFYQTGEARNITAALTSPRVVTATVKDRFGNPVIGAALTGTLSGDAFFGTGTNVATGTTGSDGTLKFVLLESATEVTLTIQAGNPGSSTYQQTDALKGLVESVTATDVFTAYTAGTTLTAEEGVGASYDAAGNNTVIVSIPAVVSEASVAADAAAEATDAANAATDAANAAAEAADAATAAAQDAADAVAALSAQVATLISGLKSQLTALTNLVIKIQKKVKA